MIFFFFLFYKKPTRNVKAGQIALCFLFQIMTKNQLMVAIELVKAPHFKVVKWYWKKENGPVRGRS